MAATTATDASRRSTARDALRVVLIAALLLVVLDGEAVGHAAVGMKPGLPRDVVRAVGRPTGWVARSLPLAAVATQATGWLSPDEDLGSADGGFSQEPRGGGTSRVAPQAFSAADLGGAATHRRLGSLLVTGDSMSQPLDAELARRLAKRGVRTVRDAHIGTGISKSFLVDWGKLAVQQAARDRPDAVVVFLGANEGYPMKGPTGTVTCCGAAWAAEYATRARAMIQAYRRDGATQVYWLLIPTPRDPARAKVIRTVNAAARVAAAGFGAEVTVVDTPALFTPGNRFRSAMPVGGRPQIVRNPDGIHLDELGAGVLADRLVVQLGQTFSLPAS